MPLYTLTCSCGKSKKVIVPFEDIKDTKEKCECGDEMIYSSSRTLKNIGFDCGVGSFDRTYGDKSFRTEEARTRLVSALADETGRTQPW